MAQKKEENLKKLVETVKNEKFLLDIAQTFSETKENNFFPARNIVIDIHLNLEKSYTAPR